MRILENLAAAIQNGDRTRAKQMTDDAIQASVSPDQILAAMVKGMDEVGQQFQCGEVFVPEMLIASRAMKESMAVLEPKLVQAGIRPAFTAVIGTVQGDLHDIGKNLVAMTWKGASFEVVDLGTNVSPEKFVAAATQHKAAVIGLSALLTTTMPAMKQTVQAIRKSGIQTKVMIGGAPITEQFARDIGADAFAEDAARAVNVLRQLVAH
jgi:5-methyltetrahydrofolate--homocysteine methyltransferase